MHVEFCVNNDLYILIRKAKRSGIARNLCTNRKIMFRKGTALRHSNLKCTLEALDLYAVLIKVSTTKKQFTPLQFMVTSKIGMIHPHHTATLKFKWYSWS